MKKPQYRIRPMRQEEKKLQQKLLSQRMTVEQLEKPVVQRLLDVLGSEAMRLETEALGGYDVTNMGKRLL